MKYLTIFHLISTIFNKSKVRGILIGGFAVNYYKVSRQTADVDFLITKNDFEKIVDLLKEEGYKQEYIQDVFAKFKGANLYLMDLDFMFVEKETLDIIMEKGKEIEIAGQKLTVPSLEYLIALKLHSIKFNPKIREIKDLPDIIGLIKINKVDIHTDKFKKLCLKYGSKELYDKILEKI